MTDPGAARGPAPWSCALVTGASSGIGEAMCRELAARGVGRLVVVARREERLAALADELRATHETTVEVLPADLTDAGQLAAVEARLRDPADAVAPVDLLVNNAGFATYGRFHELPLEAEQRELALNVEAVVRLSHAALGGMVERGHGSVLAVASLAANQATPRLATYSASKAFVTMFTEGLAVDLEGTGVTATVVLPGYTRTEFATAIGGAGPGESAAAALEAMVPSFALLDAAPVAAAALDAAAAGKVIGIPGLGYKIVNALEAPLPRSARRRLVSVFAGLPERLARGSAGSDQE